MIVVEKRNYSVNPWRLVNDETGQELFWRQGRVTDSSTSIWTSGFPTKQAAIEGMGRMLDRLLDPIRNLALIDIEEDYDDEGVFHVLCMADAAGNEYEVKTRLIGENDE